MAREIRKVVVLGANGAMGSGSGQVFAARGIPTVFLARDLEKAEKGRDRAVSMAKSEAIAHHIRVGTYDDDLEKEVADADLVFEAVAERLDLKKQFFQRVDGCRRDDSIVATVSSGLSIDAMVKDASPSLRRNFMGIHFYNPPNVIVGCEVIPNPDTDRELLAWVSTTLERDFGRVMVETADTPAFAGNRVGFKVLNEVALLAEEHGVAFMDMLIGPHTGRAMPPLATADLVGWDVHRAIVDNIHANTDDEAHDQFALPGYMAKLIELGHLGNKTPGAGGFFKTVKHDGKPVRYVLHPKTCEYHPVSEHPPTVPDVVRDMKRFNRFGRYEEAMQVFLGAQGKEADLMRKVILGYVSYALNRVGSVVAEVRDVDRIMGFGFNWAPPGVLVDYMGVRETIAAMEKAGLQVPEVLAKHGGGRLFDELNVDRGRFFVG